MRKIQSPIVKIISVIQNHTARTCEKQIPRNIKLLSHCVKSALSCLSTTKPTESTELLISLYNAKVWSKNIFNRVTPQIVKSSSNLNESQILGLINLTFARLQKTKVILPLNNMNLILHNKQEKIFHTYIFSNEAHKLQNLLLNLLSELYLRSTAIKRSSNWQRGELNRKLRQENFVKYLKYKNMNEKKYKISIENSSNVLYDKHDQFKKPSNEVYNTENSKSNTFLYSKSMDWLENHENSTKLSNDKNDLVLNNGKKISQLIKETLNKKQSKHLSSNHSYTQILTKNTQNSLVSRNLLTNTNVFKDSSALAMSDGLINIQLIRIQLSICDTLSNLLYILDKQYSDTKNKQRYIIMNLLQNQVNRTLVLLLSRIIENSEQLGQVETNKLISIVVRCNLKDDIFISRILQNRHEIRPKNLVQIINICNFIKLSGSSNLNQYFIGLSNSLKHPILNYAVKWLAPFQAFNSTTKEVIELNISRYSKIYQFKLNMNHWNKMIENGIELKPLMKSDHNICDNIPVNEIYFLKNSKYYSFKTRGEILYIISELVSFISTWSINMNHQKSIEAFINITSNIIISSAISLNTVLTPKILFNLSKLSNDYVINKSRTHKFAFFILLTHLNQTPDISCYTTSEIETIIRCSLALNQQLPNEIKRFWRKKVLHSNSKDHSILDALGLGDIYKQLEPLRASSLLSDNDLFRVKLALAGVILNEDIDSLNYEKKQNIINQNTYGVSLLEQ